VIEERDRIIQLLLERGAHPDELSGSDLDLFETAMDVLYRPERPTLTLAQVAARRGLDTARVVQLWRAFGLDAPAEDEVALGESDVRLVARLDELSELFGPEVGLSMARVAGASMARLADAGTSSFVTTQAVPFVGGSIPFEAVEINALVADNLSGFMDAMDTLFRRHLQRVRRPVESVETTGAETQDLVVAFADLVDSTGSTGQLSLSELSAAIDRFEATAIDIVVGHGGRVAKFIGDEVMFVHRDATGAVAAALDLLGPAADLAPMRIGVDAGPVLTREGDFFGPVVNVAARATSLAAMGSVLVTESVVDRLEVGRFTSVPRGSLDVRGHGAVSFWEVGPAQ